MEHDEFNAVLGKFIVREGVRRWLFNQSSAPLEECLHLEPIAVGRYFSKLPRPSEDLLKRGVLPTICRQGGPRKAHQPDVGDTYVFHHYDGNCAVGLVLGSEKYHPILPIFAKFGLVSQPKSSIRHFAVDLTSHCVDFIETSRVEDDLFLIAVRRTFPHPYGYPLSNRGEARMYRADLSTLKQFASSGLWSSVARCLTLRFSIQEAAWSSGLIECRFCSAIGRVDCECIPLVKGRETQCGVKGTVEDDIDWQSRHIGDWTSWRQFLQGVQCEGHMIAHWRTVDIHGKEMEFLSNNTAYSLQIKSDGAARQMISLHCSTSGPHEVSLAVPRLLSPTAALPTNVPVTPPFGNASVLSSEVSTAPRNVDAVPWTGLSASVSMSILPVVPQQQHRSLEHSVPKAIAKRTVTRRSYSSSVDEDGRAVQIWVCEQCGQRIRGKKGNYNRHIAVKHRNELRFKCMFEGCGQVFGYKLNAQRHFLNKHLARTFPCGECQRTFKSESKRDSHITSVHDPSKASFFCVTCGAAFGRRSTLNRHMKNMHT